MRKSPGTRVKIKEKMTKEQIQLAIIKKKECDSKALKIVEQLLEPQVDPVWLIENLKYINKCHMEDVIEERAITKLCGYVLCQKPLSVIINQKYHISLKSKKVFDVTKRKNFCSSTCFGASNYLLEQMLTSPLWLRNKEKIPDFRVYSKDKQTLNFHYGEVVDISLIETCSNDEAKDQKQVKNILEETDIINDKDQSYKTKVEECKVKEISGSIEDFVHQTFQNINKYNKKEPIEVKSDINTEQYVFENCKSDEITTINEDPIKTENLFIPISSTENVQDNFKNKKKEQRLDIEEYSFPTKYIENKVDNLSIETNINVKKKNDSENIKKSVPSLSCDKIFERDINNYSIEINNEKVFEKSKQEQNVPTNTLTSPLERKTEKSQKSKKSKKKNIEHNVSVHVNLAAKVEESFKEWITDETIDFLFGDHSVKLKAIEKIETQDKYSILCQKLNRLQFEDEHENDDAAKEKTTLKPAPHFAILQEEGHKLNLKVNAFYQGKTTIEESKSPINNDSNIDSTTFLPLTDAHAPLALRRKIFLDRLDQIIPDLLRTLSGNNEAYARACCNYTSLRCTAVKALVHTFSLTARNIMFKTAEWTLVGLVIIKMLSLLDPWLTMLLITKQANVYISMILTSYKLHSDYLNLLVASYNPNMNIR